MAKRREIIEGQHGRSIIMDINGDSPKVVVFVHGFKGYKDWGHFNLMAESFAEAGFTLVKFNFSHNGGTMENPIDFPDLEAFGNNTFSIEQDDLGNVLDWIESNLKAESIDLIGHSRGGGAVLLKTANDSRIRRLITWASVSTFDRWNQEVYDHWKREGVIYIPNARTNQEMPLYWVLAEDYFTKEEDLNIEKACRRISIPTLIIHGTNDETVPYSEGESIHEWIENSQLKTIADGGHTFDGKHPWIEKELPKDAKTVIEASIEFLR